jgi:hypothetical protein
VWTPEWRMGNWWNKWVDFDDALLKLLDGSEALNFPEE